MQRILPIVIGAILAAVVVERGLVIEHGSLVDAPSGGVMLAECSGTIQEIVIHYVAGDAIAMPVYQQFIPQLSNDVIVYVVCPDDSAFDEFARKVGPIRCTLSPVIVKHPITVWSRDRWVAIQSPDQTISLLAPRDEDGADAWPQRAGDARVALDIVRQLRPVVSGRKLGIYFDGGDLLASQANIFVTPAGVTKNVGRTVASTAELVALLAKNLSRKIVLLNAAPDHHAGMYMMAADDRTMLVGDPSLAKSLGPWPQLPGGADFSEKTQSLFDAVAHQLAAMRYRVVRIPTIPASDGKTYLTYVNVLSDYRGGKKIVYMPTYRGADALNAAAAKVWQSLGFEVHAIDCTSCYRDFGTLHCLVNILRRSSQGSAGLGMLTSCCFQFC